MQASVCGGNLWALKVMVVGEGFEPSKSMTADLQSAPFGRSGTPPRGLLCAVEAGRIIPNERRL